MRAGSPTTAIERTPLVVDIGGGTSDFSLFELHSQITGSAPRIKREAVGDKAVGEGDV